jgi:hypothetical protein
LGPRAIGLVDLSSSSRVSIEEAKTAFFPLGLSMEGAFEMTSMSSFLRLLFDDDLFVVTFRFVDVDSAREKKVVIGTSPRNGMALT